MTTVLIADDEAEIVDLIRDYLEDEGYRVLGATDGAQALGLLSTTRVDCVVLDVMMPKLNGFDLCQHLRAQDIDVPILFLSAKQSDVDKIRGLALGGDDYLGKPFSPGELVARVKALLRRYPGQAGHPVATQRLRFGHVEMDLRSREVFREGQPVHLTVKEYELLLFLAENPRQVFTREQLFDRVWGDFGDLHTVTVHVRRLREKIEADPSSPTLIMTVWGVGYRFEGRTA